MPDFVLDMVIETCEGFLRNRDGRHYLITTFVDRLEALEWLDDEQREQYYEENRGALANAFFPVYDTIIAELKPLRGRGGTDSSDRQKEYYRLLMEQNTSSNFAAERIIGLLDGLLEQAITGMDAARALNPNVEEDFFGLALSKGTIQENMDYLKSVSPTVFPALPGHTLSLEILPESMSFINAAAYYLSQPVDDYYHNIIRVNPAFAESDPSLMYTLAHEGYGGHLLESVFNGHSGMGKLRRIMSMIAWGEGFAEYAAGQLLRATGFDEALVDYAVHNMAFEFGFAARVEIGIFHEGWTTDDLSGFIEDYYGYRWDEEEIQLYYEQIFASKYTFIRYAAGNAFFRELRDITETELDDSFDVREYHTLLLDIGYSPLNIFEEVIAGALSPDSIPPGMAPAA